MSDIERAKRILTSENLSCIILKNDTIYKSQKRGVAPIMELINNNVNLDGFCAADKVIGKAAAMLFIYSNIEEIYAPIMSLPAIEILKKYNIKFSFDEAVPFIINRTHDGQCPMEESVKDTDNPKEALKLIIEKINHLQSK